jgi:uncharacterized protein
MAMRSARPADAAALAALWNAAGLHFRAEYVERELQLALVRNADLVLVDDGPAAGVVGSVFGTFDGRRGWLNRLATIPDRRGNGIATALVGELERRLLAKGCVKINLLVEPGNADVTPFYERRGFRPRSMIFMDKWLASPPEQQPEQQTASAGDPAPLPPAVPSSGPASLAPAVPSYRPVPGAALWTGLDPALYPDPYVFVTVRTPPRDVEPFAVIREDEGITLVVTRDQADRSGLSYGYLAARVSLTIGSSLSAVGLTATVSHVLAGAGISCNVIAGFHHDHLFVDWERGAEAAALLRGL